VTAHFRISVLAPPRIDAQHTVDRMRLVEGADVTLVNASLFPSVKK
jgi:hypothetical protein